MLTRLRDHAVELAWRHWTALGVRGVAPAPTVAIDLEALIAFTPAIAAADPRLADEARDWCARIARGQVAVARLKQIARRFPSHDDLDLPAIAIAAALGRPPELATSGKSAEPVLANPALLQLRARHAFGGGTRADLLVTLLRRHDERGGARVAELTGDGATKRNTQLLLDELTAAGLVERLDTGNTARYRLVRAKALAELLAPIPATLVSWPERLTIAARLLDVATQTASRSATTRAVELTRAMTALRPTASTIFERGPVAIGVDATLEMTERWALSLLPL